MHPNPDHPLDVGLLSPVRAGTKAAAATDDAAWLRAMLDAEAALVRAQARLGVAPSAAAATITKVAGNAEFDIANLAISARGAANPIVAVVGALGEAVAALDPTAAEYVHRGSTSQDIMDTASMLVVTRTLRLVLADADRIEAALIRLAREHRDTVMAGRTLGAHAVPITFGLKVAGWLVGVHEAATRLREIAARLPVQLGGAAGTLAGYVESARIELAVDELDEAAYGRSLVEAFAAETGLAAPELPWHTGRTQIVDVGFALTLLTGALGKIAVDVQGGARTEIGELSEPAAAGRGVSSAMPHKRNPALATLIRSAAVQAPGLAACLAQCLLAEDERSAGLWHAEWQPLRECLRLAGGAAATAVELSEGLTADADRMRANVDLTHGLIASERVSAVLVPALGRVGAIAAVRAASVDALARNIGLATALAENPVVTSHFSAEQLTSLLDPARYLGTSVDLVDRVLSSLSNDQQASSGQDSTYYAS